MISFYITYKKFYPIFIADEIIIPYGFNPFDICQENPILWHYIKIIFIISYFISNIVISNLIYSRFLKKINIFKTSQKKIKIKNTNFKKQNQINLLIGKNNNNEKITLPELGLYQNILITGTIGSGKTSSAMYPFTEQFIKYNSENSEKIGMLILDVKGNYYNQVRQYAQKYNLEKDLIVIELNSNVFYNPLHKPNLKPQVLANRIKTILTLFSENNSESYWLDKVEQIFTEAIKICRIYNNNYVTFLELNKLITDENYFYSKLKIIKNLFISNRLNKNEIYELNSSLNFFQKEFFNLDQRTKGILISEITRITNTFISDYDVVNTFCSSQEKLSFKGFEEVLDKGKIVVLNMNIAEYELLSKIIAAYLKLDFQSEVLQNLSKNNCKKSVFICDEYDKYCTKNDGNFFSTSREAKCINIISTQSYSSLKNTLKDEASVKVIIQNLINKIWFRTDDLFTIEEAQKQLGKEDKEKISKTISENAQETKFSYITNSLNSRNSNISETYNTYLQNDFIFETNYFTQKLETFTALTFLSDGNKILKPEKLYLFPYFKEKGHSL